MRVRYLYSIVFTLFMQQAVAQQVSNCMAVIGRPSQDSIMLRWAPLTHGKWQDGNRSGYTIERYTLVRDGQVLSPPERKLITQVPLKPLPLDAWEPLVNQDKYAAIAAQALYGGSFEIDMAQTDVFQIVNKAKENEQRFQFALFSADMSVITARASGLLYTDKSVDPGEKYLYRISVHAAQDSCTGSVYMGPGDDYALPVISAVKAEREGEAVRLQWQRDRLNFYTAYAVERSENGKTFARISDEAITNFSPAEQESSLLVFASDTVTSASTRLWYRVVGITPFGEYGPVGEAVEATTTETLADVPYIHSGYSEDNKAVTLKWDFPEKLTSQVTGFHVDRASSPRGTYNRLTTQLIPATGRVFTDTQPQQVNYYRVSAVSPKGQEWKSPIYLVQLIDSIPPMPPVNLSAQVDDYGNISLRWKPNTESDIYGYRVYRANYKGEELAQLTYEPISEAGFPDKVNLNTLNRKLYYQVMAIDRNQNHSVLSDVLEVKLPDKVKPVSPVFLPVKTSDQGIELKWQPSSSDDVTKYDLYRQVSGEKQWMRITSIPAKGDSVYHYTDTNLSARSYHYTVIAVDESGLESDPAQAVTGNHITLKLRMPVNLNTPVVDRERKEIRLSWLYGQQGVRSYMIFKSVDNGQSVLYRTIPGAATQFTDKALLPGKQYNYRVMAVFEDQAKSEMSKIVTVTF